MFKKFKTRFYFNFQNLIENCNDIPLDAIHYLIAECNYGGRITDQFDRRLIGVLLKSCLNKNDNSDELSSYDSCLEYAKNLPVQASPEKLGLHENSNFSRNLYESESLLNGILLTLPRQVDL